MNRHAALQAQWAPGQRWETRNDEQAHDPDAWVPVGDSGRAQPLWDQHQEYRRRPDLEASGGVPSLAHRQILHSKVVRLLSGIATDLRHDDGIRMAAAMLESSLPPPEHEPDPGQQWKVGDEFLPFHPQASHVPADYRDGWNRCYWMAVRRGMVPLAGADASVEQAIDAVAAMHAAHGSAGGA